MREREGGREGGRRGEARQERTNLLHVLVALAELMKTLNHEVIVVIKAFRQTDEICNKNPLPRLLRLMDRDPTSDSVFHKPSRIITKVFLQHHGVFYLGKAMDLNRSSGFTENALV